MNPTNHQNHHQYQPVYYLSQSLNNCNNNNLIENNNTSVQINNICGYCCPINSQSKNVSAVDSSLITSCNHQHNQPQLIASLQQNQAPQQQPNNLNQEIFLYHPSTTTNKINHNLNLNNNNVNFESLNSDQTVVQSNNSKKQQPTLILSHFTEINLCDNYNLLLKNQKNNNNSARKINYVNYQNSSNRTNRTDHTAINYQKEIMVRLSSSSSTQPSSLQILPLFHRTIPFTIQTPIFLSNQQNSTNQNNLNINNHIKSTTLLPAVANNSTNCSYLANYSHFSYNNKVLFLTNLIYFCWNF